MAKNFLNNGNVPDGQRGGVRIALVHRHEKRCNGNGGRRGAAHGGNVGCAGGAKTDGKNRISRCK